MSRPTYLSVVQLDVARQYRVAIAGMDAAAIAAAGGDLALAQAAQGDTRVPVDVPLAGAELSAAGNRNAVVATLWAGPVPIASWGVARRATAAPRVWSILNGDYPAEIARPAWPWLGWRLQRSAAAVPIARLAWLPDYLACAAWGWIATPVAAAARTTTEAHP